MLADSIYSCGDIVFQLNTALIYKIFVMSNLFSAKFGI